jgi:hypothetical protein
VEDSYLTCKTNGIQAKLENITQYGYYLLLLIPMSYFVAKQDFYD